MANRLGVVLAPVVASLAMAVLQPAYAGLPNFTDRVVGTAALFLFLGAYPTTLMLGLPAYLLLRSRLRPTAVNCAIVGTVVASLPWLLLGLLSSPGNAQIGAHATHVDGRMTLWGLYQIGLLTGGVALAGALGGFVFWLVAASGQKQKEDAPAT